MDYHEAEIKKLNEGEELEILNAETIIKVMKNAQQYYDKCSYVQKAAVVKILFANIIYHHQNWLEIKVQPNLEPFFNENFLSGGPSWN